MHDLVFFKENHLKATRWTNNVPLSSLVETKKAIDIKRMWY